MNKNGCGYDGGTMKFEKIAHFDPFRARCGRLFSKSDHPDRKAERCLRHFALPLLALALASSACRPLFARQEPLPVFDGVTTEFTLTKSRIRAGEQLEVRAVFHNLGSTTRLFRFLDFGVNARLYANGQLLEDLCDKGLDYPVQLLELKPGKSEITEKVFTTSCYKLAPGRYSIRFNYNLRALEDNSVRTDYEKQYGHPEGGIVPWDGRDHAFTVVE